MITVTRSTSFRLTDEDGTQYEISEQPIDWIDPIVEKHDDGTVEIRYAVHDDDPSDYEWGEVKFWNADPRYISQCARDEVEAMAHVFKVEKYEHGNVIYGLAGEASQVDRQWDVGLCGLIGVPVDFGDAEDAARAYLAEYSDWCNGSVYGLFRETYAAGETEPTASDSVWGFIGTSYAESSVKSGDF